MNHLEKVKAKLKHSGLLFYIRYIFNGNCSNLIVNFDFPLTFLKKWVNLAKELITFFFFIHLVRFKSLIIYLPDLINDFFFFRSFNKQIKVSINEILKIL